MFKILGQQLKIEVLLWSQEVEPLITGLGV